MFCLNWWAYKHKIIRQQFSEDIFTNPGPCYLPHGLNSFLMPTCIDFIYPMDLIKIILTYLYPVQIPIESLFRKATVPTWYLLLTVQESKPLLCCNYTRGSKIEVWLPLKDSPRHVHVNSSLGLKEWMIEISGTDEFVSPTTKFISNFI